MKSFSFFPSVLFAAALAGMLPTVRADVTGFGDNGVGWVLKTNSTGLPVISGDRLVITQDGVGNSARAAWFNTTQDIASDWTARFTSRIASALTFDHADGFAFVVQASASGTNALGPGGGNVGYFDAGAGFPGIDNSVGVAFQDYIAGASLNSDQISLGVNGVSPQIRGFSNISLVNVNDPMEISVHYDSAAHQIVVVMRQNGLAESFTFDNVTLSGTATIGFTGGTGDSSQTLEISDFSFTHGENAPTANDDRVALNASIITFHPLENDFDDDADSGDFLRLTDVGTPRFGQAFLDDKDTITYSANPDFPGIDSFEYTCTDTTGLSSTARVTIVNGTPAGTYRGQYLINAISDPKSAAFGTVTVTPTRAFTAQIQWDGKRGVIKGTLPVAGGFNYKFPLSDHTVSIAAGQPMGTVDLLFQVGGTQFDVTAELDVPPGRVGPLTAEFDPPVATAGYGRGWLTGKVTSKGTARFAGRLLDGQPVAFATGINVYLDMPFLAAPYKGGQAKGIVQGRLSGTGFAPYIQIRAANLPGGYPSGFGIESKTEVYDYVVPKKTEDPLFLGTTAVPLTLNYLSDGFTISGQQNVQLSPGGRVEAVAPLNFKKTVLKINTATGMFSGNFNDPNGPKTGKFTGVLLQNHLAIGLFPNGDSQGAIVIVP